MTTYRNPWHEPADNTYGPEFYTTNQEPTKYKDFLIYHRISCVFDVVKDGVCLTQMAGMSGAKGAINRYHLEPDDFWSLRMKGYLDQYGNR